MKMTKKIVLKKFFGYKPGEGLTEFSKELEALSPEEELELAQLAADELGIKLEDPQ